MREPAAASTLSAAGRRDAAAGGSRVPSPLRRCSVAVLVLLLLQPLAAFGAADRPGADGFLLALPGYEFEFPRDHGAHDAYRTEWWYYAGHLRTGDGRRYGFEVTFFRVGVVPPGLREESAWDLRNLALAHFAVTDVDGKAFRYYEKLNRSSPFTAEAKAGYLDLFNEGWRAVTARDGSWRLVAAADSDRIDLTLRTLKPPAVHGQNGISVKAPVEGFASHYYSMTRLEVSGTINGHRCSGTAWMDHEFGSSSLRGNQQGWDWFSVQLDNDTELMLYIIRRTDGTPDVTSSGSVVAQDGSVIHLSAGQISVRPLKQWRSPRTRATYPMGWAVAVPSLNLALRLDPQLQEQELVTQKSTQVTYWEGAVDVTGSFGDVAVSGVGYVEMTGYDRAFRQP
jgi:predicted secreted hydrolase